MTFLIQLWRPVQLCSKELGWRVEERQILITGKVLQKGGRKPTSGAFEPLFLFVSIILVKIWSLATRQAPSGHSSNCSLGIHYMFYGKFNQFSDHLSENFWLLHTYCRLSPLSSISGSCLKRSGTDVDDCSIRWLRWYQGSAYHQQLVHKYVEETSTKLTLVWYRVVYRV